MHSREELGTLTLPAAFADINIPKTYSHTQSLCGLRNGQVMPEVSRFFGIIIRMFVEAGAQHHMPHFHAYYQDHVGIYDIGKSSIWLVPCRGVRNASFLPGQNFIRRSYCRTGRRCKKAVQPLRLNR